MEIQAANAEMENVSAENLKKLVDIRNNFVKENEEKLLEIRKIIG